MGVGSGPICKKFRFNFFLKAFLIWFARHWWVTQGPPDIELCTWDSILFNWIWISISKSIIKSIVAPTAPSSYRSSYLYCFSWKWVTRPSSLPFTTVTNQLCGILVTKLGSLACLLWLVWLVWAGHGLGDFFNCLPRPCTQTILGSLFSFDFIR